MKFLVFSRLPGGTRVDVICLCGDKTFVNNRPSSAIMDLRPLCCRVPTSENYPHVTGSQEMNCARQQRSYLPSRITPDGFTLEIKPINCFTPNKSSQRPDKENLNWCRSLPEADIEEAL